MARLHRLGLRLHPLLPFFLLLRRREPTRRCERPTSSRTTRTAVFQVRRESLIAFFFCFFSSSSLSLSLSLFSLSLSLSLSLSHSLSLSLSHSLSLSLSLSPLPLTLSFPLSPSLSSWFLPDRRRAHRLPRHGPSRGHEASGRLCAVPTPGAQADLHVVRLRAVRFQDPLRSVEEWEFGGFAVVSFFFFLRERKRERERERENDGARARTFSSSFEFFTLARSLFLFLPLARMTLRRSE